jgi:hypothetical protein
MLLLRSALLPVGVDTSGFLKRRKGKERNVKEPPFNAMISN